MATMSEYTLSWARGQYRREVQAFLDDPTPAEAKAAYIQLQLVGSELGLEFWAVAREEGTEFEIERLREMTASHASGYYVETPGGGVGPAELWEFVRLMDTDEGRASRVVAKDKLPDGATVSTVFLGIDHNFARAFNPALPPILYETMVFGGAHDDWQQRYETRAQALAGHRAAVQRLREGLPPV